MNSFDFRAAMLISYMVLTSSMANAKVKDKGIFNNPDINEINVELVKGSVKIYTSDSESLEVITEKNNFEKNKCQYNLFEKRDTLNFIVKHISDDSKANCEMNLIIFLPRPVKTNVELDSGIIDVDSDLLDSDFSLDRGFIRIQNGKHEDVEIALTSGAVNLEGEFKSVKLTAINGQISFSGTSEFSQYNIGNGRLKIAFQEKIRKGELAIRALNANIEAIFPDDMKVNTSFLTLSGRSQNRLGEDSSSKFKIFVKAVSGNLSIEKLSES